MIPDRWRYELRVLGRWTLLTPILIMLGFALLALFLVTAHHGNSVRVLSASLELFLPLAVGVIAATLGIQDTAIELQLTMPRSYRQTVLYRLGWMVGWTALIACISSILIRVFGQWPHLGQLQSWGGPEQLLGEQLVWGAPLLWFAALGLCIALFLRSSMVSGMLLGAISLAEFVAHSYFAAVPWLHPIFFLATTYQADTPFWLTNRLELLGIALLLFLVGSRLLHNSEARLHEAKGEA